VLNKQSETASLLRTLHPSNNVIGFARFAEVVLGIAEGAVAYLVSLSQTSTHQSKTTQLTYSVTMGIMTNFRDRNILEISELCKIVETAYNYANIIMHKLHMIQRTVRVLLDVRESARIIS